MFLKRSITKSTENYSEKINRIKYLIENSDAIVIGAGAGLSTSAGFTYAEERFKENFSDFEAKYGFHDMYSGAFCKYDTFEEYWAYWSRFITVNRYVDPPKPVYQNLLELVKNKDYFVITTNVDHCFQKAGFDKKRLFYTQGDYGLFQCSEPCCQETFDNEKIIRQMLRSQKEMRIPSELIPVCPHCGKPLTMNLRSDSRFVQDNGWYQAAERYQQFIRSRINRSILFLELGVGYNTPSIIKYPFWQMTAGHPKAHYVCINYGEAACPKECEKQSICINGDINEILNAILSSKDVEKS